MIKARDLISGRLHEHPHPGTRVILIAVLLLFGLVALHRPYLPYLLPGHRAFEVVAPFATWGWWAVGLSVSMLLVRPGTLPAMGVHFAASVFFFAAATAYATSGGITGNVTTYSILAFAALLLFGADFRLWFPKVNWVKHLVEHPPQFARNWGEHGRR